MKQKFLLTFYLHLASLFLLLMPVIFFSSQPPVLAAACTAGDTNNCIENGGSLTSNALVCICPNQTLSACQTANLVGQACCAQYSADPVCTAYNSTGLPVKGSLCIMSTTDPCVTGRTGLVCVNGSCDVPGAITPTPTPTPSPAAGGKIACPDGLTAVNGLCLPDAGHSSFPTTGIAGSTSLVDLLTKIIQLLLTFAGIIAVVFLVLGGYWYMASGGNEELAEKGKKTIVNFVLGLVVIILAYTIVTILSNTLTADKFTR